MRELGMRDQSATRCAQVKFEIMAATMQQDNSANFNNHLMFDAGSLQQQIQTKKRGRTSETAPDLMRCKKKIAFGNNGTYNPSGTSVARRNERERNRVRLVNNGFATLREHVPNGARNKKMSKVDTLKSAVEYIRELQQMLNAEGALNQENMVLSSSRSPNSMCSMSSSPSPSDDPSDSSYEDDLLDFTAWFS